MSTRKLRVVPFSSSNIALSKLFPTYLKGMNMRSIVESLLIIMTVYSAGCCSEGKTTQRFQLTSTIASTARSPQDISWIRREVDALSIEPYSGYELGVPLPSEIGRVKELVAAGDPAVPILVDAIRSENGRKVGYAAECLLIMKSPAALVVAKSRYDVLKSQKLLDLDSKFAAAILRNYLAAFGGMQ